MFAGIEIKNLKKFRIFALVMFTALATYVAELFDAINSVHLTRTVLSLLYFSIAFFVGMAFSVFSFSRMLRRFLIYGSLSIVMTGVLLYLIVPSNLLSYRILNSLTLGCYTGTLIWILYRSLRDFTHKPSLLLIFRTILFIPYLGIIGIGFADQLALCFGLRIISSYPVLFYYNTFVLVAMGISFTLEAASEIIGNLTAESTIDELTQVPNRRHFIHTVQSVLEKFKESDESLFFSVIDIDHFKLVNDSHGHTFGDHVLKEVAQSINSRIRGSDMLGRLGGEEFGLLLRSPSKNQASLFFERIRTNVEEQVFTVDDHTFSITVSIGITEMNHPEEGYLALYKRADRALYRAKHEGRNNCRFE